ncbi:histidinol-phosphate transaminase [Psychrobacter sp. I-STPA10]|uniref:histidinol-phosphate transaminase n=1 Tax=Psychrobacter sp. I-STPA10 TaxID=2585769 RepID=UPI001E2E8AD7|nr:histidinol-phosphate transaminase [Psychrobacter sp. I-STPA10]
MSEQKIDNRLWSSKARNLSPYVPGEQPKHPNLCKLNTNENPFPPSPKVQQAIITELGKQAESLRLYPDPESDLLKQTLASTYGVQPEQVFVGNGSDEVLAFVFSCFFIKERPLLAPDISYSFYPVYAETFGVDLIRIPLREDFSIDTDDYRQPCGGIIIANPNAPTGKILPLDAVAKLASEHPNAVVVIDEAYIDFANGQLSNWQSASAVSLINEFDNIVVTQTFSKSRSLAGLRVGMAFANASLIEALTRMKNSFNSFPLDRLAQVGAIASLQDHEYFVSTCQKIISLREQLSRYLIQLGFEVLPSQANFIFARPPSNIADGRAADVAEKLREQGIIVRYFNKPRISDYLRITVGTVEQNQRLLVALKQMQG